MAGSSPRMRGTLPKRVMANNLLGIIPAYAGNTIHILCRRLQRWDHPRVCGEHIYGVSPFTPCAGSSPRMRGTHRSWCTAGKEAGIIPAYAGNTLILISFVPPRRDHPRVCGEHGKASRVLPQCRGSSPRMRGTLFSNTRPAAAVGIIPAYAGNTVAVVLVFIVKGDHPRVCGEHT